MARSSLITKLVLLAVAIYAVASLLSMTGRIQDAQAENESLTAQVEAANLENERLRQEIEQYSEESTEDIARDQLGLVSEGEILFYDVGK